MAFWGKRRKIWLKLRKKRPFPCYVSFWFSFFIKDAMLEILFENAIKYFTRMVLLPS